MKKKILIPIKKFTANNWQIFIVVVLATIFFFGTSYYHTQAHLYSETGDYVKWESPDESANYIFAKLYGQEGKLTIEESYNRIAEDVMRPRSFRSDHGVLKPVSFVGLPLVYGNIVKLSNYKVLPYLTAIFMSIALLFYYLLVSKLFSKNIALVASALAVSFPPLMYYTVRSMFHNVLFLSLLIIGLYFLLNMISTRKKRERRIWQLNLKQQLKLFISHKRIKRMWLQYIAAALAGIFIGLAVIVRTSELLWLAPTLILLWLMNIHRLNILVLGTFLAFLGIAVTPMLYYNQILFGSFYFGGYPEMNNSIITLASAGGSAVTAAAWARLEQVVSAAKRIFETIFFFGFNPYQSAKMLFYYFVDMFPWLFVLMLLGFGSLVGRYKELKSKHAKYLLSLFIISLVLVLYYGSWRFFDNPDMTAHTIGNSYTRYWLPIYFGSLPLAALFLVRLAEALAILFKKILPRNMKKRFWHISLRENYTMQIVLVSIIAVISFNSINFVMYGSAEGLVYLLPKHRSDYYQRQRILELTETNAVIITQYHDKIIFPERKVVVGLFNDDNMNNIYARLVEVLPVYYYNFRFPEKDINFLNNDRLAMLGLQIEEVERINTDFSLYRLYKQDTELLPNNTLETH